MTNKELLLELFLQEINSMSKTELIETLLIENLKIIRTIKNKQSNQLSQAQLHHRQGSDKSISSEEYLPLNPEYPGDLSNTKLILSVIDGNEMYERDWIKIVRKVHILARKQGLSLKDLIELSSVEVNVIQGDIKGEKGYRYLPEIDISIQGVNADRAWSIILHLAKNLNIPVEVYFERTSGQKGKLIWMPK